MKYICLLIFLVSTVACSTNHEELPKGLVPNQGVLPEYTATEQPSNVPQVLGQYTYFGLKNLVIDEITDFNLIGGQGKKIIDFEFEPLEDKTLYITQFSHFYIGECEDVEVGILWYELDKNGTKISVRELKKYNTFFVTANVRQLLRIEFINSESCSRIYSTLEINNY